MRAAVIVIAGLGLAGCVADPAGYTGRAYVSGPVNGAQYPAPLYGSGVDQPGFVPAGSGSGYVPPGADYVSPGYGYAAPGYVQPYATEQILVPQPGIGIGAYGGGYNRDRFVRERLERERFNREQFERERFQADHFRHERLDRDRLLRERTGQGRPEIRPFAGPPPGAVPVAQPRPPRPEPQGRERREQHNPPWVRP